MSWRVIEEGGHRWQVHPATEQRPDARDWSLVFYFRSPGRPAVWASTSVTSPSKAALYMHADRMTDDALRRLLLEQAGGRERPT